MGPSHGMELDRNFSTTQGCLSRSLSMTPCKRSMHQGAHSSVMISARRPSHLISTFYSSVVPLGLPKSSSIFRPSAVCASMDAVGCKGASESSAHQFWRRGKVDIALGLDHRPATPFHHDVNFHFGAVRKCAADVGIAAPVVSFELRLSCLEALMRCAGGGTQEASTTGANSDLQ